MDEFVRGQQKAGNAWEAEEADVVNQGPRTTNAEREALLRELEEMDAEEFGRGLSVAELVTRDGPLSTPHGSLLVVGFGTPMTWPLWLSLACLAVVGFGWIWSQRND